MNKFILTTGLIAVGASTLLPGALVSAEAAPTKAKPAKATPAKATPAKAAPAKPASAKPSANSSAQLPRYVSMATLKRLQKQNDPRRIPVALQPLIDGKSLKGEDRRDLITDPPLVLVNDKAKDMEVTIEADAKVAEGVGDAATATPASMDGDLLAQAFPSETVRPATPRRTPARPVTPRWVRYPLEFQLCGIGLGTKAVDKDRFNRIDRFGLFAIHGNPTAVVVPTSVPGTVISNMQQPPETSSIFPDDPGGHLPNWASAIMAPLDSNHVQWLYRRDTYSMSFVVDRLGFVDAIIVAGTESPIARTQLEDPVHTVKLGDDLRKVLFRYGYPDVIQTYKITERVQGEEGADVMTVPEDVLSGLFKADKASNTPAVGDVSAFRTFEVRYEQSYNVVFTIRNNRVVRIYIFGDPDFFNQQRRNALRTQY